MSHELTASGEPTSEGIRGIPGGGGSHVGTVRIIKSESELVTLAPGDVMVCPIATTAWSVVFGTIGAIVCDGGGALSHTAIVAREHGVPSVMATGDATVRLRDGDTVRVDGAAGTVERL
jgi:pyruvate,water dikinase